MNLESTIWNGLFLGAQESQVFTKGEYLRFKVPDLFAWWINGEFWEIDVQLLVRLDGDWIKVTNAAGVITTSDLYQIPTGLVGTEKKLVFIGATVETPIFQIDSWYSSSGGWKKTVFNLNESLNAWILPEIPGQSELTMLFVNGVKYVFDVDYLINIDLLVWQGSFPLETTDYMEMFYL